MTLPQEKAVCSEPDCEKALASRLEWTRKLCYRKDVHVMHNPTIHTRFELESPFVPSSTDCWAVWTKIRQKWPYRWP